MLFWIIVMVGIFIFGIIKTIQEREGLCILFAVLIDLAVMLAAILIGGLIGEYCISADEVYDEDTVSISAMVDNTGISGKTYFLGSSRVESDLYYYYLAPEEDGGKTVHKVESGRATVYDTEKENPHIVICHNRSSNPVLRFFFFTYRDSYKIYVPEGSIKYDFAVDLE